MFLRNGVDVWFLASVVDTCLVLGLVVVFDDLL